MHVNIPLMSPTTTVPDGIHTGSKQGYPSFLYGKCGFWIEVLLNMNQKGSVVTKTMGYRTLI